MKLADRITSVFLVVLSGLWIYWARKLPYPKFAQVSKMGPGDFPTIAAVLMAICAVWLFVGTFRRPEAKAEIRPAETPEEGEDEGAKSRPNPTARRDIAKGFGLFTLLLVLMPYLGFSTSAAIFALLFLTLVGRYSIYRTILVSVIIPALLWFIFAYLLTVPLPKGPWGF